MKKTISLVLSSIFAFVLFGACSSTSVPAGLDETQLTTTATQALDAFNKKEFNALTAMFIKDFQAELTTENWQNASQQLEEQVGTFEEVTNTTVSTQKGADEKTYVLVVLTCKYTKATVSCVISFDEAGEMVGLVFQ